MTHKLSENPAEREMFRRLSEQESGFFYNPKNIEIILKEGGEERLKEEEFADIYSQEEVEKDRIIVSALKREFEKDLDHLDPAEIRKIEEKKQWSEALEVIITQQGGECGWFGKEASSVRAARYDDYVNGVDGVLEFEPKPERQGKGKVRRIVLAIDASMNPDFENVKRKVDRNLAHLTERGEERIKVKYFESQVDGFKGELEMVIPVVVGVDGGNANRLIGLFADIIELGNSKSKERSIKERYQKLIGEAREHPAQRVFLEEIKEQLVCYAAYFEGHTDKEGKLYQEEVLALLDKIEEVIAEKEYIKEDGTVDLGGLESDGVFLSIKKALPVTKRK